MKGSPLSLLYIVSPVNWVKCDVERRLSVTETPVRVSHRHYQRSEESRGEGGCEWRTKIDTLDNDACVMAIRHLDCGQDHHSSPTPTIIWPVGGGCETSSQVWPRGTNTEGSESVVLLHHPPSRGWWRSWCWRSEGAGDAGWWWRRWWWWWWPGSQERLVVVRGRGTALVSKHNPHWL